RVTTDGVTEVTSQDVPVGEGEVPTASFTADGDGLEVTFTDTSGGSPTAWSWSFGDGAASAEANPTHLYGAAGSYEVTLDVSNAAGRDVVKKEVEVRDLPPADRPVARFRAMPEGGSFVRFVDESTGEIESRTWYFGDGATSTEKDPGHLYASGGDYEVRLVVRGPGGEAESIGRVTVR
ncbi:MAG: PKD domain-containing protein, partial [Acidobacteriota bacterium]